MGADRSQPAPSNAARFSGINHERRNTLRHSAYAGYDAYYVAALEVGMPPTAGEGFGVDRLPVLFADVTSIREVILFPRLRPGR